MEINLPDVVAEVEAEFARYERALVANDVKILNQMFHYDSRSIRYGIAENLYGHTEISTFRLARSPIDLPRRCVKTLITTYDRQFAIASTLFYRTSLPGKVGRQMQSWVKFPEGWRIVAAHVSIIDEPRNSISLERNV